VPNNMQKAVRTWRKLYDEIRDLYPSRHVTSVVIPNAGLRKHGARMRSLWRVPKSNCAEQNKKGLAFWHINVC
jgi:hypothetical protein